MSERSVPEKIAFLTTLFEFKGRIDAILQRLETVEQKVCQLFTGVLEENDYIEVTKSFFDKQFSPFFDAEGSIKISDLAQCVFTIVHEICSKNSDLQLIAPPDSSLESLLKEKFAYLQEIYNYLRDSLKKLSLCQNIIVVKEGLALDSWLQSVADIKNNLQEQRDNCTSLNETLQHEDLFHTAEDIFNDSKGIVDYQEEQLLSIESQGKFLSNILGQHAANYLPFSI
jgi:hypothetical protein